MEAIRAGTIHGARLMKRDHEFGTLEKGKLADMCMVSGNPLEDIQVLADADRVQMVLIGGRIEKDRIGGRAHV